MIERKGRLIRFGPACARIRSRIRSIASEEGKGRDPYLLALFFVPSFDEGRKISKRVELEFLEFFRKDGEERKCRLSPPPP